MRLALSARPAVTATEVHVINLDTNEVYYTKAGSTPETRAASLVKLMTAYVLLQNKTLSELRNETRTITSDDLVCGSGANLAVGDVVSLHSLLADALLSSSNVACHAIAAHMGAELLGGMPTHAEAVAAFVSVMNAYASSLRMSDTTYVDAHGHSQGNVSSPEDCNTLMTELWDNEIINDIKRFSFYRMPLTRSNPATVAIRDSNDLNGSVGVLWGKTGTLVSPDTNNLIVVWEAPNGQTISACIFGSMSDSDRYSDMRAILAELPVIVPALATPGVPFTPAYVFETLGYGGGWWDPSDTENMYQSDDFSAPVTAGGQAVGRWEPKAGTPALYFRQATPGARPTYQTSGGNHISFDCGDFLDLGAQSLGDTGLFADSGQSFMVLQKTATTASAGTFVAKAGATSGNRTFQLFFQTSTKAKPGAYFRGQSQGRLSDNKMSDGTPRSFHGWWDGSDGGIDWITNGTRHAVVGTAPEESQNILLGACAGGAEAAHLTGDIYDVVLVDGYDRDLFRRLRDWFNGGAINAFADPTGDRTTAVGAGGASAGSGGSASAAPAPAAPSASKLLFGPIVMVTKVLRGWADEEPAGA